MDDANRLEVRAIRPVWRTRDAVWVREASPESVRAGRGVRQGDRVVLSDLSAAVPGIRLRMVNKQ
jgi:hypothetical protein